MTSVADADAREGRTPCPVGGSNRDCRRRTRSGNGCRVAVCLSSRHRTPAHFSTIRVPFPSRCPARGRGLPRSGYPGRRCSSLQHQPIVGWTAESGACAGRGCATRSGSRSLTVPTPRLPQPAASPNPSARRIVAIIDTARFSGPGRQLTSLARGLRGTGVDLHVVTFQRLRRPPNSFATWLREQDIPHTVVMERSAHDPTLLVRLHRTLRGLEPDLIQTHGYKPTILLAILRTFGAPFPWVAFFHGSTWDSRRVQVYDWVAHRLFRAADTLVVMSERHRREFQSLGSRVRVLHNAILPSDEDAAGIAETKALLPVLAAFNPRLGVIGRLSAEKGVDVLLRACGDLVSEGMNPGIVIAGDGPERQSLERLCDRLDLRSRVLFLGNVPAVGPIYRAVDVVVLPSRSEGLPNVLLEAIRAEKPVVATSVGAVPEVIGGTEAGVLAMPDDVGALKDAIVRAMAGVADPRRIPAQRAVSARFSLERRVEAHLQLYEDVLARRPSGRRKRAFDATGVLETPR